MAATKPYGTTADGQEVTQFVLKNNNGLEVRCINYGCRLTHIFVPDFEGGRADVLLGYDDLASYEADDTCQGAFIGRYANRIEGASFEIGQKHFDLTRNSGDNYLHGSFHRKVFHAEVVGDSSVSFTCTSPDGEDGFPGELWVGLIYTLTEENELVIDYRAVSQADTHVNFTSHGYFNLAGQTGETIEDHMLWLNSDTFLEVNDNLCPTGRTIQVDGGAFDFRNEKPIGQDLHNKDPQLLLGGGYDHCFVLEKTRPRALTTAAIVRDPVSDRSMRLYTTMPGVQLYTANGFDGTGKGKNGVPMVPHGGFCLEAQFFPDSPHHAEFPSTLLEAGVKYHQLSVLLFEW